MPKAGEYRFVHFNTERVAEHRFVHNRIRTSLYNVFNFIPKGIIIEEFSRLANLYFLIICIFQFHPYTTNTNSVSYTLPLLMMVVLFAAFLKAKQDLARHRADRAANKAKTRRYIRERGAFEESTWSQVKVGDFLMVESHEVGPSPSRVTPSTASASGAFARPCLVFATLAASDRRWHRP